VPTTVNVRLWIDGPGFVGLALAEWLDEDEYRLRASDHSGAGYLELTTEIAAQAFGSGLGIGVMEGSSSALEGTAYTLEVMAM